MRTREEVRREVLGELMEYVDGDAENGPRDWVTLPTEAEIEAEVDRRLREEEGDPELDEILDEDNPPGQPERRVRTRNEDRFGWDLEASVENVLDGGGSIEEHARKFAEDHDVSELAVADVLAAWVGEARDAIAEGLFEAHARNLHDGRPVRGCPECGRETVSVAVPDLGGDVRTFEAWPEHGAWYEVGKTRPEIGGVVGSLFAPMAGDGTFWPEEVGIVEEEYVAETYGDLQDRSGMDGS